MNEHLFVECLLANLYNTQTYIPQSGIALLKDYLLTRI